MDPRKLLPLILAVAMSLSLSAHTSAAADVHYGYESVDGVNIFYREAGKDNPSSIVLLHGFPSSSHQYRNLIRELGDEFHVIAMDYPAFGASDFPDPSGYEYSFDNISKTVNQFLEQREISSYAMYLQDYGAPIGMRIATQHPERVNALIFQNGNLYEEGLNKEAWAPIMKLWEGRDTELEKVIASNVFGLEGLRWQYTHGTRNPDGILPDNWLLDFQSLSRPGQHAVQLDLFYDYRTNVALYPEWQQYLKDNQPPSLVVWAKNDAFFPTPGAEGIKRDVKDVEYHILDTGHFALEEDGPLIAAKIRAFMTARNLK